MTQFKNNERMMFSLHAHLLYSSGCPVYVSDKPGHHDTELLRRLVLPDGSILRAKLPGRPTRDCLFADVGADGKSALKVWNQNKNGGVIGAFNVQGVSWNFDTHENEVNDPNPSSVTAMVKPHDVESLRSNNGPFAVWKHQSSSLEFLPTGDSVVKATLNHRGWDIFTIVPINFVNDLMFAPIGLADMMNTGGAVFESRPMQQSDDDAVITTAQFKSKGPGRFVAFTNRRPARVLLNGKDLPYNHYADDCELSIDLPIGSNHEVVIEWEQ